MNIYKNIIISLSLLSLAGLIFLLIGSKSPKTQILTPNNNIAPPAQNTPPAAATVAATSSPATANDTGQSSNSKPGNKQTTIQNTLPSIPEDSLQRFTISLKENSIGQIAAQLLEQGFIKNENEFISAINKQTIIAGSYKISKQMDASQIAKVLQDKPYMEWIKIPEGLRKEEIGQILADTLAWTAAQKEKWTSTYTQMKFDNVEGVYFPDTYLIPVDETPLDIANRLTAKFNENFAVYLQHFNQQNIKWTTGLTLASIVQREAANNADMPLIARILWNRLDQNMALNVDATLQYLRGNTGAGWWAPITLKDKQIDSPYNTYLNKSLPPHPICNPGIPAIEAILNPAQTDCLYYLHDKNHVTHCAKTYEEHQANIQKYLIE